MNISEHLKEKRQLLRLTLEDVAEMVGVNRQTIQKYENGMISNIPFERIELLALALHTTPAVLMGWQEDVFDPHALNEVLPVHYKPIPLLEEYAAGKNIFEQADWGEYVFCEDDLCCDFALSVKGDSMEPRLFAGDTVFIRRQEDVLDGQIAAVLVEDSVTLKRVYHLSSEEGIHLVSDNTAYAPMIYAGEEMARVRILGLAVTYQRKLSVK